MEIVIAGAVRTAIGSFGGTLKDVHVTDLGATVIRQAMERAGVEPSHVDEVIMGHVLQAGAGMNTARQSAIKAGIGQDVPGFTINKVCGSALKAVTLAVQAIRAGDAKLIVAGGMESMSTAPYLLRNARWGYRLGNSEIIDSMLFDGLSCSLSEYIHMGVTAENVAGRYGITREEQDAFALASEMRAARAQSEGRFQAEIAPISVPRSKGDPVIFETDEYIRRDSTLELLGRLKPAFQNHGTVTAGNASGLNDGASAMVVAAADHAAALGLKVQAIIRGYASVALDPLYMGMGPVPAVKKALEKAGVDSSQIDLFELNEAFAVQSLAVIKELGLDPDRVNVNGGAIALGHPIGASGARILTTLVHEMKRRNARLGLAALCIGGGQGIAIVIELASI